MGTTVSPESVDGKRRDANRWQDVAHVDFLVHEREGFDGAGAPAPTDVVEPLASLTVVRELDARAHSFQRFVERTEHGRISRE